MTDRMVSNNDGYRYGFNGKEHEDDMTSGDYDFGARIYDSRIAKFLSIDRYFREYPSHNPYQFALNNPIHFLDNDGNVVYDADGNAITLKPTYDEHGIQNGFEVGGNFAGREKQQELFNAMLKTEDGVKAMNRVMETKQTVTFEVLDTQDPKGESYAETNWFNNKRRVTESKNPADFNDENAIKITIYATDQTRDLGRLTRPAYLNIVGIHEILGHISDKGKPLDRWHNDLVEDLKSPYTSTCMRTELNIAMEYLVSHPNEVSSLPVQRYLEIYDGTIGKDYTDAESARKMKADVLIMLQEHAKGNESLISTLSEQYNKQIDDQVAKNAASKKKK